LKNFNDVLIPLTQYRRVENIRIAGGTDTQTERQKTFKFDSVDSAVYSIAWWWRYTDQGRLHHILWSKCTVEKVRGEDFCSLFQKLRGR